MPKISSASSQEKRIVIDVEMVVRSLSVSEADKDNPAPKSFYVACMINEEETQISVSGFEGRPAEFQKWVNLPKGLPVIVRAELHFSEYQGKPGIRFHQPQIQGVPEWVSHYIQPNANGKAKA